MTTKTSHCSLAYHRLIGSELDQMAHAVAEGIYTHSSTFASPPITQTVFNGLLDTYHEDYEAYKNGGKSQKGAYLISKNNLMAALDSLAAYVDALPDLDEATIFLSGFTPTKTGETKAVVPDAPVIDSMDNSSKGMLVVDINVAKGAEYYGCLLLDEPMSEKGIFFIDGMLGIDGYGGRLRVVMTKGRKKMLTNLESKREYWCYAFAGNSAGVSVLSDGVSKVCG